MSRYRPPTREGGFEVNRVLGKFRPTKINNQRGVNVLYQDSGVPHKKPVLLDNCEDDVAAQIVSIIKNKLDLEWRISLNQDWDKVLNFHPAFGQYKVKVHSFPSPEGEPPKPKTRDGKYGEYQTFTVLLEIQEPETVSGILIPCLLHYTKFHPFDKGEQEIVGFASAPGKSKHTDFLMDFCDAVDVWRYGEMEWKDNLLPDLEKRIEKADKEFNVVMADGWVDSIYPIFDYDSVEEEYVTVENEDWDEEDESPPWDEEDQGGEEDLMEWPED